MSSTGFSRSRRSAAPRATLTPSATSVGGRLGHVLTGDETLRMPEIGVELLLSRLDVGIDLEPEPDGDAG